MGNEKEPTILVSSLSQQINTLGDIVTLGSNPEALYY